MVKISYNKIIKIFHMLWEGHDVANLKQVPQVVLKWEFPFITIFNL